jgi:hypothetical protein
MTKDVKLLIDGQMLEVHNALIGARMNDRTDTPFSLYAGNIDLSEVGVSLLHVVRGVIKINREEHGLNPNDIKDFLLFTVRTALDLERDRHNDYSFGYSMESLVKKFKDNQF